MFRSNAGTSLTGPVVRISGKTADCLLRWVSTPGQKRPWSETASATIEAQTHRESESPMSAEVVIQIVATVATFLALAVALFPGFFQRLVAREFVRIEPQNIGGTTPRTAAGDPVVYFHLKARNRCPWLPVHNCRVMLRKIERLNPASGAFEDFGLHVPLQFVWSPASRTGECEFRSVVQEEVFDFLLMNKPHDPTPSRIRPVLYTYLNNVDLMAHGGQTVRYHLSVVGNEFASKRPQIWEVRWDGVWTDSGPEIAQHVSIREVPNA